MNELRNYLLAACIASMVSALGTWKICYTYYKVKSLELDNSALNQSINNLKTNNTILTKQINITESNLSATAMERDTIKQEYDYANAVIRKYQVTIDSLSHLDPSFLRVVKLTESANTMPTIATVTAIPTGTDGILTPSGAISYISKLRESLELCKSRSHQKDIWYDETRNNYNAR